MEKPTLSQKPQSVLAAGHPQPVERDCEINTEDS